MTQAVGLHISPLRAAPGTLVTEPAQSDWYNVPWVGCEK
jgi:hypothetical protein